MISLPAHGRFEALEHHFTVMCDVPALSNYLANVLKPMTVDRIDAGGRPPAGNDRTTTYRVEVAGWPECEAKLFRDGRLVVSGEVPSRPVAHLLHQINANAIRCSTDSTLLHTAAALVENRVILLPGQMGAGKSTLVTALARAGATYLTDELVAIDPDDAGVRVLTRAASLDPGSWPLFPDLRPDVPTSIRDYLPAQWQVSLLPPRTPRDFTGVSHVFFHEYHPEGETELRPVAPVEALRRMLEVSFTLKHTPGRDLRVLASLLDDSPTSALTVADLDEACARVLRMA